MERFAKQLSLCVLLALCLSGCALGPNYRRPAIDAPENFRSAITPAEQRSLADLPWWEIFKDETLQRLMDEALQNNYDLLIAAARVEQARQIAAQARGQFFPQMAYDGIVARGKNSFLAAPSPNGGMTEDSALLNLNVFWEIDFWGRIRRLNEAARAQYLATEEGRMGVVVSLVADVAQAYFELLELDLELEIAKRNTLSREETLRIFTQRLEGGVASKLETASAEALVSSVAASIPELERQIVLKENQINVLLGRNPGPVSRNATLLEQVEPPEIPAGLPSALLERRPDIRQAEQNLRAANAQIGVAMANFFPQIGLTTVFGKTSPELSAFTAGTANLWAVAGTMTGPLFQGGTLVAQYRQAKAAWEEARLAYEQVVLNAFQEVSNALISRQKLATARAQQARAVKAYGDAVQVSTKRYVFGKASYYEVLLSQQNLFPAETILAQIELSRLLTVVQLYKALGGGWQETEICTECDEDTNK
ncbi:MAG: efflux transporter outer membrane subunit [Syntrophobacteraceae bacterium]|nr:efflux transporter outer membrane subunit [Syntrophobacteraceae bacterium]